MHQNIQRIPAKCDLNKKISLSTLDLIEMYHGLYKPYWWTNTTAKKTKE